MVPASKGDMQLKRGHRRVMVLGLNHFRPMATRLMDVAGWTPLLPAQTDGLYARVQRLWHLLRCDAVYFVGGFVREHRLTSLARILRRPVLFHWVGTDILRAGQDLSEGRADPWLLNRAVHLAEVGWTQLELRKLGLRALEVPLTSTRLAGEPLPMPNEFTVLTYLPPERAEFYGQQAILRAAREYPTIRFLVVASQGAPGETAPNIEWLGYVEDMAPLYAQSTVLVRLTEHDGLSFMVLEALSAGRHVIWSQPFQHTWHATDYDSLRESLRCLLDMHEGAQLEVNSAGAAFVKERYGIAAVGQALAHALDCAVTR